MRALTEARKARMTADELRLRVKALQAHFDAMPLSEYEDSPQATRLQQEQNELDWMYKDLTGKGVYE